MADHTKEVDRLITQEYRAYETMTALRSAFQHHRFHTYRQRKNLIERMRRAERRYHEIYRHLLRDGESAPYSLYQRQQAKRKSGFNVTVELSLDGFVFSNPAPKVPNGARVWVRAKIEENHTGEIGIPKTHEMIHITWSYYSGFHKLDTIGASGRDEYLVSNPLIITREFTAPASGSTKHNFFVYVDAYEAVPDHVSGYVPVAPTPLPDPPIADFTGTPLSGDFPLSVAFTDASSGTPASWLWDFGDGATSTAHNPTHIYASAGTFTVALTATNAGGSDTKTRTAYVAVTAPSVVLDNFNRTVAPNSWGTSSSGPTWVNVNTIGSGTAGSVDGSVGVHVGPAGFAQMAKKLPVSLSTPVTFLAKRRFRTGTTLGSLIIGMYVDCANVVNGIDADVYTGQMNLYDGSTNDFFPAISPAPAADQWFWVRWHITDTLMESKVWIDGSAEPGAYQYSRAITAPGAITALGIWQFGGSGAQIETDDLSYQLA